MILDGIPVLLLSLDTGFLPWCSCFVSMNGIVHKPHSGIHPTRIQPISSLRIRRPSNQSPQHQQFQYNPVLEQHSASSPHLNHVSPSGPIGPSHISQMMIRTASPVANVPLYYPNKQPVSFSNIIRVRSCQVQCTIHNQTMDNYILLQIKLYM